MAVPHINRSALGRLALPGWSRGLRISIFIVLGLTTSRSERRLQPLGQTRAELRQTVHLTVHLQHPATERPNDAPSSPASCNREIE